MRRDRRKKASIKRKKIIIFSIIVIILILLASNKDTLIGKAVRSIRYALTGEAIVDYEETAREKLNFNYDWQFSMGQGLNNAQIESNSQEITVIPDNSASEILRNTYKKGSSGESWESVSLPHTYNSENVELSDFAGTAYYTKTFTIPSEYEGKRIYVEFEAARQSAKISINGNILNGSYENGFISFGYDLTDYINYGGENVIVVMVDNSFPYYSGELETKISGGTVSKTNAIPWHDYSTEENYGGLYRNSYLYVVDNLALTLPVYSFLQTEGTYVYTSDETDNTAKINIEAEVKNSTSASKNFKVVSYVKNAEGKAVLAIQSQEIALAAGEKTTVNFSDTLKNITKWSTTNPYLYTVECKVICDGKVVDNNETELGIRTYKFTNDYGAYLNGEYTKLVGWNQNTVSSFGGLGGSYPDWMQYYTIKLMKDANANLVRWGYCAGSAADVNCANKYGLVTIQSAVDGSVAEYTETTYDIRSSAFRDMLIYFRNDPSILVWEIGNESITDISVTEKLIGYIQKYDHGTRTYSETNTDGVTTYNSTEEKTNSGSYAKTLESSNRLSAIKNGSNIMSSYVDIGMTSNGNGSMNNLSCGNKPVIEAEYNKNIANSTEEEFAISQVVDYYKTTSSASVCGGVNDKFSGTNNSYNNVEGRGEINSSRTKTDAYYVDKVIFGNTVSSYLIGKLDYEAGRTKDLHAVAKGSEIQSATLTITEENGTETKYNGIVTHNYLWTFKDVECKEGIIEIEFKNSLDEVLTSDLTTTKNIFSGIKISEVNVGQTLYATGSDILLLDIEALDQDGNTYEKYEGDVDISINSQSQEEVSDYICELISSENTEAPKTIKLSKGKSRIALKTTMNAGAISVTASVIGSEEELDDTYNTESIAIDNANGYTTLMNFEPEYFPDTEEVALNLDYGISLMSLENQEVVNVESELATGLKYGGSASIVNEPILQNGATIYNDTTETFTSVPYRYLNAEYLRLPSVDKSIANNDFLSFTALRDIDVIILRDPDVPIPSWMLSFTKTDDVVEGSNGVVYNVYKKSYAAESNIILGSNADTEEDASKGWLNIYAIKETRKVENSIFFEPKLDTLSEWISAMQDNTTIEPELYDDLNTLHFTDSATGKMAIISRQFATLTEKFKVMYDIKILDKLNEKSITNDYIRVFLYHGEAPTVDNYNVKTSVTVETFISSNAQWYYCIKGSGKNSLYDFKTTNEWHTIEYDVNSIKEVFKTTIDGNVAASNGKFDYNNLGGTDCICFGTGNNSLNNFYISNVSVVPTQATTITDIKVNGESVYDFNSYTLAYKMEANDSPTITVVNGSTYNSHTVTLNDDNTKATIVVNDTDGTSKTYTIYLTTESMSKTELRSAISQANGLDLECFSVTSANVLTEAISGASTILNNNKASLNEINSAINNLRSNIESLEIDRSAINNKYNN